MHNGSWWDEEYVKVEITQHDNWMAYPGYFVSAMAALGLNSGILKAMG